jgi:hypothetical protein
MTEDFMFAILTDDQREKLAKQVEEKFVAAIESLPVNEIQKIIMNRIKEMVDDGYMFDDMDFETIANKTGDIIVNSLNDVLAQQMFQNKRAK